MGSKKLFIIILLSLSLILPGCWSRTEIESLAIVGGLGIDLVDRGEKQNFLLTATIIRPALAGGGAESSQAKGQPVYWRVSSEGKTMAEAERNMNLRLPRRIFYGHLRFVLINEQAARQGMVDIFDYLQRNMRIRPRVLVLVTSQKAAEVLINRSELETTISRQLEEMDRIAAPRTSKARIYDLAETTDQLIAPGLDPLVTRLAVEESPPAEPGGKPLKIFRLTGGGAIQIDKLVGWLSPDEVLGYLLGIGEAKLGPFSIQLRPHYTDDVSVTMTREASDIEVEAEGDKVTATIKITAEGDLSEYHGTEEIATAAGLKTLEKKFTESMEKAVLQSVKKSQQLKSDFFGFGAALHRSNPREWKRLEKKWYSILPEIEVKVKVNAQIRRTGMVGNSFKPK